MKAIKELSEYFDASVTIVAGADPGVMIEPDDGREPFFIPADTVYLPDQSSRYAIRREKKK